MKATGIGFGLALLGCLCAIQCGAAETPQDAAANGPGKSGAVWTNAPVQPWNNTDKGKPDRAAANSGAVDLRRKAHKGELRRYMIRRQHLMLDRQGKVLSRTVCEGIVRRTLLREVEPGVWSDRTEWEEFAASPSQIQTLNPQPQPVPGASGVAYVFSPRTFDYLNPPGDYSRIKDPMTAYELKVVGMDVAGFDSMVNGFANSGKRVRVGDSTKSAPWGKSSRIGEAGQKEVVGAYQLGESATSFAGITRRDSVPCALLWYSAEGNAVRQESKNTQLAFRMNGTEYFRGTISVSLKDGHIVAAELWGPVVNTMEVGFGSQPLTELPVAVVLQQVSMWELPQRHKPLGSR